MGIPVGSPEWNKRAQIPRYLNLLRCLSNWLPQGFCCLTCRTTVTGNECADHALLGCYDCWDDFGEGVHVGGAVYFVTDGCCLTMKNAVVVDDAK